MVRDLKQRFVDGLILVLAADHRGARARARARGGAGDRDRHAAEGHARRHGAAEVAARRGRGGAPPARGRPAADRVRQRPARRRCRARRAGSATSTACARAGSSATSALCVVADDFMVEPGRRAAERLLARARPDAIFCANDLLAVGALAALRDAQASTCRGDVAVVGMDNTGLSRADVADADHDRPRLGRARPHRRRAAVRADRATRRASRESVSVEPRLVVRASSGAARVSAVAERAAGCSRAGATRDQAGVALSGRESLFLLIPVLIPSSC